MSIEPVDCEIISRLPATETGKPPLLFVHGALQGAWCWEDHWLPAAAERGWPAYAVSLRGHGNSPGRQRLKHWGLRHYVADVLHAAGKLPSPPVLIGHSMGGMIVQRCLTKLAAPAGVLVASVGASGGWDISLRILRNNPLDFLRIALGVGPSPLRKRHYSFADHVPDDVVRRCRARLGGESTRVQYELARPRRPRRVPMPLLVLGGGQDGLISQRSVRRTAKAHEADVRWFPRLGHNMMLEPGWEEPLTAMLDWLDKTLQPAVPSKADSASTR